MGDRNHVNNRLRYTIWCLPISWGNTIDHEALGRFQLEKEFPFALLPIVEEPSKLEGSVPRHYPDSLFFSLQLKLTLITTTTQHSRVSLATRASLDNNTSRLLDCAVLVLCISSRVLYNYLKLWKTNFKLWETVKWHIHCENGAYVTSEWTWNVAVYSNLDVRNLMNICCLQPKLG